MKISRTVIVTAALISVVCCLGVAAIFKWGNLPVKTKKTVEDVEQELRNKLENVYLEWVGKAGGETNIVSVTIIVIKEMKTLELWFSSLSNNVIIKTYPILAQGRAPGPKLTEGDGQTPEGFYRVVGLNPNSQYHLSLKLDYPNSEDTAQGSLDGRSELGSDIFIHGRDVSIGCIALGDQAIEELFYTAIKLGKERFRVMIAPYDLRREGIRKTETREWVIERYKRLKTEMERF